MRALALLLALLAPPAAAETIVLGLSAEEVGITATFDGSDILVFGAVRRDAPPPPGPLDVVVAVSGPPQALTVRHAERRLGLWVNAGAVEVDAAPSFYAVATTRPFPLVLTETEDLRHRVGVARALRAVGNPVENRGDYLDALLRIRAADGRYRLIEGGVELAEGTLFRAEIALPADLVEGLYTARILLTREGRVIDVAVTAIDVRKVGIERWLHALAEGRPPAYGLLALALAGLAGWGASAAFQALRA